jgi:hypothetical protein
MTRGNQTRMRRRIANAVFVGAILVAATGCGVGVGPAYPADYYDDYPSDAYIATATPFYFEGRPAYWYGNHWYYRDGGRWNHYDREPAVLQQRRTLAAPVRRNYEPGWGRPAGRPAGYRGGHGGGHR